MSDANPDHTIPTLADVARHSGVSTATVSRCLNAPERVVEQTRKRVMQAVAELGYSPNFGARALAAKRTNTIGAVIPTMENAIFARGLQAFQEELQRHGVTLLVASSSYRADLEDEQVRTLVARGADGLLLIGYDRDPGLYAFLQRQNVPVLVAWAFDRDCDLPAVGFDNFAAMRALAQAVLARGHRRIGIISAQTATNDRARERVRAIQSAAATAGIAASDLLLVETQYGIDQGAEAFGQLMAAPDRPSVVMCGNDVLAAGALSRAAEMGLRVPGDVSITGFDDIELAKICVPPLATVHVPHRRMAAEAARSLLRMVAERSPVPRLELETRLELRGSLGLGGGAGSGPGA